MAAATRAVRYVPYRQVGAQPNIVVDGAPLPSTRLTLSHWPVNATPAPFKRDTSTETALAWVERNDPRRVAAAVTNNHFDEDGLLSMFTVLEPQRALSHRELLIDASRAGDFGVFRSRPAARLCFVIEAYADPGLSPLPRGTFSGPSARRVEALYRAMLSRLPPMLGDIGRYRRYWRPQDEHLAASEQWIADGRVIIEEEPDLDLAIVRIPEHLEPRTVRRYLARESAPVHPFAIHNATRCNRLVRLQGRRIEFQYRYESWLQIHSRRPALRVDLARFCRWLNTRERHGRWTQENPLAIAPRLHLGGEASSIEPAVFLRELRRHLAHERPIWDPHHWQPATRRA
jgi:hypothetical protein